MLGKIVTSAILFGIIGLVIGYLLFARGHGGYVNPVDLFFPGEDLFSQIGDTITGRQGMRNNTLLVAAVGAVVGAGAQIVRGRR